MKQTITRLHKNAPALIAFAGICVIALAMVLGPFTSPPEFAWLRHSTSEQAGQQVPGAWIMRAGFVAYGLGTSFAAMIDWRHRTLVRAALAVFGAGLIGTALWSNASIVPGVPSDMHEDWMHSIASGVVGFAFAAACAARIFAPGGSTRDRLAWVGLIISVIIPLAMGMVPEVRGLLQRIMFAFSFLFVGREFFEEQEPTAETGTARRSRDADGPGPNAVELYSTITCPECGHSKHELMPSDACQFFYDCEGCGALLKPNKGDCCVFCSYGDTRCPPVQEGNACCIR